jgi:hypothetical protein
MNTSKRAAILQSVEKQLSQLTTREFEQGRQYLGVKQSRNEITQSVRKEIQRQAPSSTKSK